MTKEEIKEILISTNIFVDNEYLDKYCDLIYNNLDTKREKFKTQKHHVIPIVVYKIKYNCENRATAIKLSKDDYNYIVNLSYCNHILAHLYLSNCAINELVKSKLICCVNFVIRSFKKNHTLDYEEFLLENKDLIQNYYEGAKHIVYIKEDTPDKISKSLVGRISICKDGKYKYVYPNKLSSFINDGWVVGHNKQTDESRNKIRNNALGRKHISKDGVVRCVKVSELDSYIKDGWIIGDYNRKISKSKLIGRVAIHNETTIKYIDKSELNSYVCDGWNAGTGVHNTGTKKGTPYSEEHKQKLIENNGVRGKTAIHKGKEIKYVDKSLLDYFLDEGYVLGTGNSTIGSKGKKWITNDIIETYVIETDVDKYISNGWRLGRSHKK